MLGTVAQVCFGKAAGLTDSPLNP
uniref:Uncharacterized protein n=1 Tax=Arundo donax TaxID=35708 RepID=A0A0A8YNF8_ARUDO